MHAVRREISEIGREILTREGVVHAAILANEARKRSLRIFCRALEHHVLQHVREPCTTHDLIAGTDPVPDLNSGNRRFRYLHQQHLHAVRKDELMRLGSDGCLDGKTPERGEDGKPPETAVSEAQTGHDLW